jgi:hypothetical protein
MIRRDHNSIDRFGQGKVEAVVHTSLRIQRKSIGHGKEPLVGMTLEWEMLQLLQDHIAFGPSELPSPNLFGKHVAEFQRYQCGNMESSA